MGFKLILSISAFTLIGAPLAHAGLFDDLTSGFAKSKASVKDVQELTCQYTTTQAKAANEATCKACGAKVKEWKGKFDSIADTAATTDKGLASSTGSTVASGAGKLGSSANDSLSTGGANASSATFGELSRSKNATGAASQFKQCSKDIHEACDKMHPMPDDRKNTQAMLQACDDADSAASKVASETKKSGDTLGDMGKLMDTASKAMGAAAQLAQMMQQQQQQGATAATPSSASGDGGATSPTPSSINPETSGTGASSGTGVQASSVGFGMPGTGNSVAASVPGGGAGTSAASASNPYRDPASSSSSPLGSGGAAGGSVGASGGGSGGGGSGGGSNGTGASRPGEGGAAADAAANNYEVNGAGGRAIVGLKPSKGDMDAVSDGSTVPPALDAAKLDDLGGKGASESAAADDELAHDSESIFLRVRQKYSLLKGAGRI